MKEQLFIWPLIIVRIQEWQLDHENANMILPLTMIIIFPENFIFSKFSKELPFFIFYYIFSPFDNGVIKESRLPLIQR